MQRSQVRPKSSAYRWSCGVYAAALAICLPLAASGCREIFGGAKGERREWIEWKAPSGRATFHASTGAPLADESRVYMGADTGFVAFDRATGKMVWRSPIDRWKVYNRIITRDGALLFAPEQRSPVYSLDAATGAVRWRRDDLSGLGVHYAQTAADDRAWYVGTNDLRVLALHPGTGATLWETRVATEWLQNSHLRGVSVSGDTVYAAAERCLNFNCFEVTGVIVALDRATGAELWRWQGEGKQNTVTRSVPVAGRLLLGADRIDNTFFAVDRFTGREVWRVRGERGFVGPPRSPVVAERTVYVGMGDTRVYAADLETGRVLWSTPTGSSIIDVAVCGGYVIVHNQDVFVVDRRTGKVVAKPIPGEVDDFTVTDIGVHGNRAYIAGAQNLYSIRCD
jgi:outer membrane protein assembly factor BamB